MLGRSKLSVLAIVAAFLIQTTTPVWALDLECLDDPQGELLEWRSSWQPDGQDQGMIYEVTDARVNDSIQPTEITLLLKARGEASKSNRGLTVKKQELVSELCKSIKKTVGKLIRQNQFSRTGTNRSEEVAQDPPPRMLGPDELAKKSPFIAYLPNKGWVRSDKPALGEFGRCEIGGRTFVCLEQDKNRYGEQLVEIEAEMKFYEQIK